MDHDSYHQHDQCDQSVRGPGQDLGPGQEDQDPDLEADINVMYFFNMNGLMTMMDGMHVTAIKADQGPDHQLRKGTKVCTLSRDIHSDLPEYIRMHCHTLLQ